LKMVIDSSFLTAGQRCTAARRLILPPSEQRNDLIAGLIETARNLRIGAYTDRPEPFMGPVITPQAANKLLEAQEDLERKGARPLLRMELLQPPLPFVSPAILDASLCKDLSDKEYFGPFLQLFFTSSFEEAVEAASNTKFGLSAGLISEKEEEWKFFSENVQAGIINWNAPLTGASSNAPFGGVGFSGNHRPSGYFAVDYCNYPVASMEEKP
jgi:succinylglutamic semialdehyde dehydrogenase